MVALQCHYVLHICSDTRLLPMEPTTQDQAGRLPKDQLPRRVLVRVRTDVSVRSGGGVSRRFEISSCSCAATLLLGRGQRLRTDGARRWAGARFDPLFCRCVWLHQVPLGGRRARARVVVQSARGRLASRVSGSFGVTCRCRSLQHTHTNMIDVPDLCFRFSRQHPRLRNLLRRWLWKALQKPRLFVLKRPPAQTKDTELLKSSEHAPNNGEWCSEA